MAFPLIGGKPNDLVVITHRNFRGAIPDAISGLDFAVSSQGAICHEGVSYLPEPFDGGPMHRM